MVFAKAFLWACVLLLAVQEYVTLLYGVQHNYWLKCIVAWAYAFLSQELDAIVT